MTKVLLVSQDKALKKLVDLTLGHSGFLVHTAQNSKEGWKYLDEVRFELVMIDLQLTNESGLAMYKSLRQFGHDLPVLMVGEGEFDDFLLKDMSTQNYAYILKPFKFRELKHKINVLMATSEVAEKLIVYGDLQIDVRQQIVRVKDTFVKLGKTEMKILMLLARKTGEFVHPKKIKTMLEMEGIIHGLTTFYYVSKLRNKLKEFAGEALDIILVKDHGYRLEFKAT